MANVDMIGTLTGDAFTVAAELCAKFPAVVLTSAKRAVEDQARAMAQNCAVQPLWILGGKTQDGTQVDGTYLWSRAAQLLHNWSASHVGNSAAQLCVDFSRILKALPVSEMGKISKHLAGLAFDVQPSGDDSVKEFLRAAAVQHGGRFLEKEGGLVRWHWQAK